MNIYINKVFNQVFKMKNAILVINLMVLFNKNIKDSTRWYCLVSKKERNAEDLFVPSML